MYILFTYYIYDAFVHQNWKVHWAFMSLLGFWNVWTTRALPLAGNQLAPFRFACDVSSPKNDHASHAENRSSCLKIMGRKVYKAYSCIHVCSFRSGDHGQNSKPFVACADSADGGRLKREPCDKQWTPFWTYMERFPEYCTSNPPWKHV